MEQWKSLDFLGYPNYSVSSLGRVYNHKKQRYLNPGLNRQGYYQVSISNKTNRIFGLHRLIALAFIPNPENKKYIDHINTIKTDNRIENLRWVTASENINNPLTLKRLSEAQSGKTMSQEARAKMSKAHKKY